MPVLLQGGPVTNPVIMRSPILVALLLVLATSVRGQEEVQTVEFHSPAVERMMKYNIVLPAGYESSQERYPVLYLLHGLTSNYTAWSRMGAAFYAELVDDLIIVMPDVGNSWYVNWDENGEGQRNDWEDHIIVDVIGHVDANFRTITRREGRAINGLSMGGYGGLTLGLRHPELFVSIGSTSGALSYARGAARRMRGEIRPRPSSPTQELTVEQQAAREASRIRREAARIRPNPSIGIDGFSSQAERSPLGRAFLTPENADAYDPFALILNVPREELPHIYLDSGTEDNLINVAREFAQVLFEHDIPFDFMQMPGRHNGAYWVQSLGHIVSIQYEVIRRALGERPASRR